MPINQIMIIVVLCVFAVFMLIAGIAIRVTNNANAKKKYNGQQFYNNSSQPKKTKNSQADMKKQSTQTYSSLQDYEYESGYSSFIETQVTGDDNCMESSIGDFWGNTCIDEDGTIKQDVVAKIMIIGDILQTPKYKERFTRNK